MAKTISLQAQTRKNIGRNAVKSMRRNGIIPGVVYGKRGTLPIELSLKELNEALHLAHSENVLVDLKLTGENGEQSKLAFLQDMQHHPLKDVILHIDLHEIAPDEKLHVEIPVRETGESEGVKSGGGLLETPLRRLKVECLPKDLPEEILIDVTALKIGDSIHVRDVPLPPGVVILNPKDQTVITVAAPVVEEAKVAAPGDAKQPEVLKEKKPAAGAAADPKAAAGAKPKAAAKK
jgi:large subunit ribosomal protein L25